MDCTARDVGRSRWGPAPRHFARLSGRPGGPSLGRVFALVVRLDLNALAGGRGPPRSGRPGRAGGRAKRVGDVGSNTPATTPEPSSGWEPKVPAWVGKIVWRSIWQLIAAVLITLASVWA